MSDYTSYFILQNMQTYANNTINTQSPLINSILSILFTITMSFFIHCTSSKKCCNIIKRMKDKFN